MSKTHSIVRFHRTGGPEVLEHEVFEPTEPGPGEALVEIDAIGVNRAEAAFRCGHYVIKAELPSVLGSEAVGRVTALGKGVDSLALGDNVLILPYFLQGTYGIYASAVTIPAKHLTKLEGDIDPVQQAALWIAFLTAWGGLREAGQLEQGQFVVLPAASSSVGLAAIQIARQLGAIPIATTRKSDKADALYAAGAAHVIATDEQDLAEEIGRITENKGVPLAFDPVAGPFAQSLFPCLADHGQLIIYGGLSNQPAEFPRHAAIRGNLSMRGYNFFGLLHDPVRFETARKAISQGMAQGEYKMPVDCTFALEDAVAAHQYLESNQHIGKVVITV